ncbi:MAG: DEAD/DEAH box helicase family protein [Oscillospiraceae bacterium]|jgi:hypothetical protein|nr:DEAD/DEAH box helicase family protein [Oscillospiraceae bacterium]
MSKTADLRSVLSVYYDDPAAFFTDALGFAPDPWQCAVLRDIVTCRKVSVRSGQGVGKTALEAGLVIWFLLFRPFSRVVVTAPTMSQLYNVLWPEIAKWLSGSLVSDLLTWSKTRVEVVGEGDRWFAVAKTAKNPESMQGFHAEHMLFLVDEASGVDEPIMEAIVGTLSGAENRLLLCGNPTRTSGTFYDSFTRDRQSYACHHVSALDSPRTNRENIEALLRKYGKHSNVARVRVFGEPPLQEDDVFLPIALIERSINTDPPKHDAPDAIRIACDVARFGDDKTVIAYRIDERVVVYRKRRGQDTMKTAAEIVQLGDELRRKNPEYKRTIPVCIDVGGVGGGVVDRLTQLKKSDPARFGWLWIIPVHFGKVIKHRNYHDTTTLMFGILRDLLDPPGGGAPQVILPNDTELVAQLSSRKYSITIQSKAQIESKKAMKKRGLPSPDEADCVLLLCVPIKQRTEAIDLG